MSHTTSYIFYVALPCLVLNALGIKIDLYDEKFLWDFIFVFLVLRALALAVASCLVALDKRKGVGHVAALWLSFLRPL